MFFIQFIPSDVGQPTTGSTVSRYYAPTVGIIYPTQIPNLIINRIYYQLTI